MMKSHRHTTNTERAKEAESRKERGSVPERWLLPIWKLSDLYEKTSDNYCAPGPRAPRPVPKDPNHICVPGQWCPPGYLCPPGFELKVARFTWLLF